MKPANRYALYRLTTLDSGRVKGTLIKDQYIRGILSPDVDHIPTVLYGQNMVASILGVSPQSVARASKSESKVLHDFKIVEIKEEEAPLQNIIYLKSLKYTPRYRVYDDMGNPMIDVYSKEWFNGLSIKEVYNQVLMRDDNTTDRRMVNSADENVFTLGRYQIKAIISGVDTALPNVNSALGPIQHCARHFSHYPPIAHNLIATPISYLPRTVPGSMLSSVCAKCAINQSHFELARLTTLVVDDSDPLIKYLENIMLTKYNLPCSPESIDMVLRMLLNPCDLRYVPSAVNFMHNSDNCWRFQRSAISTPDGVYGSVAEHVISKLNNDKLRESINWTEDVEDEIYQTLNVCQYLKDVVPMIRIDWLDPANREKLAWYAHFVIYCGR